MGLAAEQRVGAYLQGSLPCIARFLFKAFLLCLGSGPRGRFRLQQHAAIMFSQTGLSTHKTKQYTSTPTLLTYSIIFGRSKWQPKTAATCKCATRSSACARFFSLVAP